MTSEAAPLVRVEVDSLELEGLRAALENERREYDNLLAQVERMGRLAVEACGDTDCDVAQAGFNMIRALAARARKGT
jgi:hypothetical protein